MIHLGTFIQNVIPLKECCFFLTTLLGAIITQILSFNLESVKAIPFLRKWFEDKSENWYARCNCVALVFVGTILSFTILEPDSPKTSLFAGLAWCGTLLSLGQTKKIN